MIVTLYTRAGCHLCDDVKALLYKHAADFALQVCEVDIDQNADLTSRFGDSVPVLEINGKERFRGRISPVLLLRQLRAETR